MRNPLASDWVAADTSRPNNDDVFTLVGYNWSDPDPLRRATSLSSPLPAPGDTAKPRVVHSYRYDPTNKQSFVDVAGLTTAIGFTSKITYDDAWRTLSTTDATGAVASQTLSPKDQQLTATDPAGRVSTTVYDYADRPIDSYGPAPGSCFTGQVPTVACASTVPRTHTNYDENLTGLSAAYYTNETLTGAPKTYTTGIGGTGGVMARDWAFGNPEPSVPGDYWSARMTGEVVLSAAGAYTFYVYADDGVRMWVNDQLIIDDWIVTSIKERQGTFTSPAAGTVARVRIEYFDHTGQAYFGLGWIPPGQGAQTIPATNLRPRYGLTTSTITSESAGVPDSVSATRFDQDSWDPVFGLPTRAVSGATGGLQLTGATSYETLGTAYLRQKTKTMPNDAVTTYDYYDDTETRANPCVGGSPAVNQGGMAKKTTLPTPAAGPARYDEQIYDASGRVVATSESGDWSCTTYDTRDRIVSVTIPGNAVAGARTITTNYAVGGDPLTTSVTDYTGTITTTVDLLGRVVATTDVHGVRSEATYDQPGRLESERLIPPNVTNPPQLTTYTYDDAGRLLTTTLDTTTLATSTYTTAGELATVTFANGSKLQAITRDDAGRTTALTWRTSDGTDVVSTVTRTRAGTITDESLAGVDARPVGANYVYDAVGRLTEAWSIGHHYTYDFTSATDATCPTGTSSTTGTNTNRVRLLDDTSGGTAITMYCYDSTDRVLTTSGATTMTGFSYDSHGNTTQYTTGGAVTTLGYDQADRNLTASVTGADPAAVSWGRDATDRITRRTATQGDTVGEVLYGYTAAGDTADLTMTSAKLLLTRSFPLPGGVLYTARYDSTPATYDHPTVRGDLCLTTTTTGTQSGPLRTYSPYGDPLTTTGTVAPDADPDNQPGQSDYGWLGQHQRPHEHAGALNLTHMGARPYHPTLGRVLTIDPIEGGSANDYDYTSANPINNLDLDGKSEEPGEGGGSGAGGGGGGPRIGGGGWGRGGNANAGGGQINRGTGGLSAARNGTGGRGYSSRNRDERTRIVSYTRWSSVSKSGLNRAFGLNSRLLGRSKRGIFNSNDFLRFGWSWKGDSRTGRNVLRFAFSSKRGLPLFGRRIPPFSSKHLTIWPWGPK